ncbi:SPOR domain-containing protein [Polaribacter sp.]|uniref:SPOR domain-containing protein n=1 Tax=Polaribacter sp. TaxID=1920175 RepID=UPI003F6B101F
MKNVLIGVLFFLMMFSCGKKEASKGNTEPKTPEIENVAPKVEEVKEEPEVQEYIPELIFTVQIAALRKQNEDLYSIEGVSTYNENGFTKFRLGDFKTYKEARAFRAQILNEYKGAFVQALKNGVPISITEALQNQ